MTWERCFRLHKSHTRLKSQDVFGTRWRELYEFPYIKTSLSDIPSILNNLNSSLAETGRQHGSRRTRVFQSPDADWASHLDDPGVSKSKLQLIVRHVVAPSQNVALTHATKDILIPMDVTLPDSSLLLLPGDCDLQVFQISGFYFILFYLLRYESQRQKKKKKNTVNDHSGSKKRCECFSERVTVFHELCASLAVDSSSQHPH